jgi:hypothetical protein
MNRGLPWERNIDGLQPTMVRILEEIYKQMGFIGMILLAGPEPGQGENISILE